MEEALLSEGKCIYCREVIQQNSIAKHLAKHLSDFEKKKLSEFEEVYHLSIKAAEMFLQVLVKGTASFKTLDTFLRKIG